MDTNQVTVYLGGTELTVQNGSILVDELRGVVTLNNVVLGNAPVVGSIVYPATFAERKLRPPRDRPAPWFRRGRWE